MAERPAALRFARRADAVGLVLCAVVLVAAPAKAAKVIDAHGTDPTAAGSDLAWERPGTGGILLTGGRQIALPGDIPAIGGSNIAWRNGSRVTVANRATLQPFLQFDAAGVNALAVSDSWVAFRRSDGRHDSLEARPLASPTDIRSIAAASFPNQLGRPSLDGGHLLFTFARGTSTAIVADDLGKRRRRTLRRGSSVQYLNPSRLGGRVLYVKVTRCRQELRLIRRRGERVLMRLRPTAAQDIGFEPGHTSQGGRKPCPGGARAPGQLLLWTTALSPTAALVTELHTSSSGALSPSLLSIRR